MTPTATPNRPASDDMGEPMRIDFPHLQTYVDDHGRTYHYYRRHGRKIRIHSTTEDPVAFARAYDEARALAEAGSAHSIPKSIGHQPKPGTFRWVSVEYFRSTTFGSLDPDTQRVRRRILEACFLEPWQAGSVLTFGDAPLARLDAAALRVLRDRKRDYPEAARSRIKAISRVFDWTIEAGHATRNPCRDVKYPTAGKHSGFHSWTSEEVEKYEARHPIGTKARLAFALLLYTGQRGSDVHLFGPQHVSDGWLRFTQQKNAGRNPVRLQLPMLPVLRDIIAVSPTGPSTFLVTEHGKPFSRKGFGQWFRKRCDEAGLPHCTAHGLRKAGAVIAAENGATAHELMSIFGWRTIKEAERYTRAAEQKHIAGDAMSKLMRRNGAR